MWPLQDFTIWSLLSYCLWPESRFYIKWIKYLIIIKDEFFEHFLWFDSVRTSFNFNYQLKPNIKFKATQLRNLTFLYSYHSSLLIEKQSLNLLENLFLMWLNNFYRFFIQIQFLSWPIKLSFNLLLLWMTFDLWAFCVCCW